MSTEINKQVTCYEITVTSEYEVRPQRQTDKTFRLIANNKDDAMRYVNKYYKQHGRRVINTKVNEITALDLTQTIECKIGPIGSHGTGKVHKHPDIDQYDS